MVLFIIWIYIDAVYETKDVLMVSDRICHFMDIVRFVFMHLLYYPIASDSIIVRLLIRTFILFSAFSRRTWTEK